MTTTVKVHVNGDGYSTKVTQKDADGNVLSDVVVNGGEEKSFHVGQDRPCTFEMLETYAAPEAKKPEAGS